MNIAQVTASASVPRVETIDGTDYPVKVLSMADLGRLQRFLEKIPRPNRAASEKAKLLAMKAEDLIDEEQYRMHLGEAVAEDLSWPPRILEDPRASRILMFEEAGQAELMSVVLGITSDAAKLLAEKISIPQWMRITDIVFAQGDPDPKSPATV